MTKQKSARMGAPADGTALARIINVSYACVRKVNVRIEIILGNPKRCKKGRAGS